jgi:hypothetical protein
MVYFMGLLIYIKSKYLIPIIEVYMFHFRKIETKFLKRIFFYIFMNIDVIFIYSLLKMFWNNEAGKTLTKAFYYIIFWINITFFITQPIYYLKNKKEQTFRLFLSVQSTFYLVCIYFCLFLNSYISAENEKFTCKFIVLTGSECVHTGVYNLDPFGNE